MKNLNTMVLAAALALTGCAGAPPVVEADPVIAGKRYVDAPVSLGPVKMLLRVREGAPASDAALAPQNLQLSLGFLARNDTARVVLSRATLVYGADGTTAEVVTRHEALGSAQGCPMDGASVLPPDYWFNASVGPQTWICVTLGLVTPGRRAGDVLELRMEPLNVNGELIRALPITFAQRPPAD